MTDTECPTIFSMLLKGGASIDEPDIWGFTSLALAICKSKYESVECLLDLGAGANTVCCIVSQTLGFEPRIYKTPLDLALQGSDLRIVSLLLKFGANVLVEESNLAKLQRIVMIPGYKAIANIIVHRQRGCAAEPSKNAASLKELTLPSSERIYDDLLAKLLEAIEAGDLRAVKSLLARGCPIRKIPAMMRSPLATAILAANNDIVAILVNEGAEFKSSHEKFAVLETAIRLDAPKIARLALEASPDREANQAFATMALFRLFSRFGPSLDESSVNLLIGAGADLRTTDQHGRTLLGLSVQHGNLRTTRALVAAGAELERRSASAFVGSDSYVRQHQKIMLFCGGKPSPGEHYYSLEKVGALHPRTPLAWVTKFDDAMMQLLLENGADWRHADHGQSLWPINRFLVRSCWFPQHGQGLLKVGQATPLHERLVDEGGLASQSSKCHSSAWSTESAGTKPESTVLRRHSEREPGAWHCEGLFDDSRCHRSAGDNTRSWELWMSLAARLEPLVQFAQHLWSALHHARLEIAMFLGISALLLLHRASKLMAQYEMSNVRWVVAAVILGYSVSEVSRREVKV